MHAKDENRSMNEKKTGYSLHRYSVPDRHPSIT